MYTVEVILLSKDCRHEKDKIDTNKVMRVRASLEGKKTFLDLLKDILLLM